MTDSTNKQEHLEDEKFQAQKEQMMKEIEQLKLDNQYFEQKHKAAQREIERLQLSNEIERLKRSAAHKESETDIAVEAAVGYVKYTAGEGLELNEEPMNVNKRSVQERGSADLYHEMEQLKLRVKELEKGHKVYPKVPFLNYKDRKRILISGGAGFVGSHLVDKLMMQGHEVTVVDNFFTGRKKNVEHWIGHENFELIHADIVNPLFIEVDQIYHLASPASPPNYMYNPVKTLKTNTVGTLNMLGLAKRCRARLLLASTSEVYGDPEVHPQTEEYWGNVNPIGPRACYDEGKRVAETMCYAYQKQEHLEIRVARIFNTFGPRMHMNDGRVVSNFILQALQGEPITIYGKGDQTRSFQYVSDLVDGLEALMNGNFSLPVNLGNPDEYTIAKFAETIKNMIGGNSKIVNKPLMQDDPRKRKPDITRAMKHLHWQPKIKVLDGINRTIEYFRDELKESHMIH